MGSRTSTDSKSVILKVPVAAVKASRVQLAVEAMKFHIRNPNEVGQWPSLGPRENTASVVEQLPLKSYVM